MSQDPPYDPHATPGLDRIPDDARAAVMAHVARLKHDLGKYVALRQRWLSDDAPLAERRAALMDDLLATRRGPDGTQDALSVWRELRPALVGEVELPGGWRVDLRPDPDLTALEAGMAELAQVVDALRVGEVGEALVGRGFAAALAVAEGCRSLERRVRSREASR